jgi:hypothetical protein
MAIGLPAAPVMMVFLVVDMEMKLLSDSLLNPIPENRKRNTANIKWRH